jgi:sporulation protein YlmC with PRC-barrel domain
VTIPPAVAPSAASPATAPSATQRTSEADTARLIGRTVRNAAEESIGEVTSVVIGRDGSVSSVIVGVGGFLGVGQREVAIRWQDLQIRDNGATVHTNVTREQLAALPAYQYAPNQRPGVIAFPTTVTAPAATAPPATAAPVAAAAAATGGMSANDLIGSSVRSPANESIGRVYDVLLDRVGAARSIVVSSGGMLGIGDRRVEVPYSEVRFVREGTSLTVVSRLTAAQIAQVAEYTPTAR